MGSIPELGSSLEEMAAVQYSCLESPMDRGPWLTTVHETQRVPLQLSN